MKSLLLFVPALLIGAPAAAQPAADPDLGEITRVLNDPRVADQFGAIARSLSKAVLDMPVGEIQAAVEGRPATPADKARTVRDLGRADNPNFERDLERQIAQAQPAIRSGMKAMSAAIPSMMQAMTGMAEALERATANMPDPTYPKR